MWCYDPGVWERRSSSNPCNMTDGNWNGVLWVAHQVLVPSLLLPIHCGSYAGLC